MINGIASLLSSPVLTRISQSTSSSVSIETSLKAIGRPTFILADPQIKPETKNYAATKEFLYQLTCLATYMLLIIPVFKKGSYKLAKKMFKDEEAFKKFKNAKEYLNYKKFADMPKNLRIKELNNNSKKNMFSKETETYLRNTDKAEKYNIAKGAIELGNTIGSVLGLAIFAPQVSHLVVHPVLNLLGIKQPEQK